MQVFGKIEEEEYIPSQHYHLGRYIKDDVLLNGRFSLYKMQISSPEVFFLFFDQAVELLCNLYNLDMKEHYAKEGYDQGEFFEFIVLVSSDLTNELDLALDHLLKFALKNDHNLLQ